MNFIKLRSLILFTVLLYSCKSPQEKIKNKQLQLIENGYLKGIITDLDTTAPCNYLIKIDKDAPFLLDAINLPDSLKTSNLQVFIKFLPLRMKNRCTNASPVKLRDIKVIKR